jgi:hypothetical protein
MDRIMYIVIDIVQQQAIIIIHIVLICWALYHATLIMLILLLIGMVGLLKNKDVS